MLHDLYKWNKKIILQGNVCGLIGEMHTFQEPDIDDSLQIQYIIHMSELEWKTTLCLIIFASLSTGKALKRYCEIQCNKTFNFSSI
jgi:hypothetical protein